MIERPSGSRRSAPRVSRFALRGRLAAVAALVPRGSRVADVGTDHALLARGLVASGRASYCIATDRDRGCLAAAGATVAGLRDRLELRHAEGLRGLRAADRIDVLALCGLGARAMIRILEQPERGGLGLDRLVLQPQTEPARLRAWLAANRLAIVAEELVLDRGRHYVVLSAESARGLSLLPPLPPPPPLTADDLLEVGPRLARSSSTRVRSYWSARLRALSAIASRSGAAEVSRRRDLARRAVEALDRLAAATAD